MKQLVLSLIITASCFAQEARILIVDSPDAQKLAAAYSDYKNAQRKWEALKKEVASKYVPTEPKLDAKGKATKEMQPEPGWESTQFSGDFRAIVPANSQYANRVWCNGSGLSWVYPTGSTYWGSTTNATGSIIGATTGALATTNTSDALGISNNTVVNDDGLIINLKAIPSASKQ